MYRSAMQSTRPLVQRICSLQRPLIHRSRPLFSFEITSVLIKREMSATPAALDLRGIYPPIATPFDENENISYEKLEKNMQLWNEINFRGYVVQGSNGEYVYLTPDERVDMVAKVKQLASKDKLIIAGSGCESTRDTVTMTRRMAEAGADAVLVVTPCYYKGGMNSQALEKHYTKLADESPIPVILYNVPPNTGIDMDQELIVKLSSHRNIIGLKDSGGDIARMGNLVYRTQQNNFQILAGSASFLYPALSLGCVGGVCALANMLGRETCELQKLYEEGKMQAARELQHRLIAPNVGVTRRFGVAGLKVAMEWFGYYGGPLRSPLLPLQEQDRITLKQMFVANGFKSDRM